MAYGDTDTNQDDEDEDESDVIDWWSDLGLGEDGGDAWASDEDVFSDILSPDDPYKDMNPGDQFGDPDPIDSPSGPSDTDLAWDQWEAERRAKFPDIYGTGNGDPTHRKWV